MHFSQNPRKYWLPTVVVGDEGAGVLLVPKLLGHRKCKLIHIISRI